MTRKEFIKISQIFGLSIPFNSMISACSGLDEKAEFEGKVIIIGAGAGGLSAGYFLSQRGIDFEILEASASYGGRMKRITDFADFPIPLGAEWLHTNPSVFNEIVNDNSVKINTETVGYTSADTVGFWDGEKLIKMGSRDTDRKFVNSTWFDFFDEYIVDSVRDRIRYNQVVQSVNYSDSLVVVNTSQGRFTADKIILSVPLKILQDGDIRFIPEFPQEKKEVISGIKIWDGYKAFIEFSERFYDTAIAFDVQPETDGQKLYYDAAFGQNTEKHILGLFLVGTPVIPYASRSGDELRDYILNELDDIYDDRASSSYVKHIVQNWNEEPFIRGAYITDHENYRTVRKLRDPIGNKVYFAGGPFTDGQDWVAVHAAALSAKNAVEALLDG